MNLFKIYKRLCVDYGVIYSTENVDGKWNPAYPSQWRKSPPRVWDCSFHYDLTAM